MFCESFHFSFKLRKSSILALCGNPFRGLWAPMWLSVASLGRPAEDQGDLLELIGVGLNPRQIFIDFGVSERSQTEGSAAWATKLWCYGKTTLWQLNCSQTLGKITFQQHSVFKGRWGRGFRSEVALIPKGLALGCGLGVMQDGRYDFSHAWSLAWGYLAWR